MSDPKTNEEKPKVVFTDEQTEFINSLFAKAHTDAAEAARKAAQTEMEAKLAEAKAQFEAQLEEVKKAAAKTEPPVVEPPKVDPQLEALKAQQSELKGILEGIKGDRDRLAQEVEQSKKSQAAARKKDEFLRAMKDANVTFFDPLEAFDLAEKDGYEWDDTLDRPVVKNKATGLPRLNQNAEPMDPVDFVKDFANRKKYLVKAPNAEGGTGSGEQRRVEKKEESSIPDVSKMTAEEFEAYRQTVLNSPRKN